MHYSHSETREADNSYRFLERLLYVSSALALAHTKEELQVLHRVSPWQWRIQTHR